MKFLSCTTSMFDMIIMTWEVKAAIVVHSCTSKQFPLKFCAFCLPKSLKCSNLLRFTVDVPAQCLYVWMFIKLNEPVYHGRKKTVVFNKQTMNPLTLKCS